MAVRFAGTAYVFVNGRSCALRGNLTVSPSAAERVMLASQLGITGYQEVPRTPYIEGDFSTKPYPDFNLEDFLNQVDITVVAQAANGYEYVLHNAVCKGGLEAATRDGQVRVRWEGVNAEEILMG